MNFHLEKRFDPRKPATQVSKPTVICSFNKLKNGEIILPATKLRVFRQPPIGLDLNDGIEEYCYEENGSSIIPILKALGQQQAKVNSDLHFVTYRNNLNKIMKTTYDKRDAWRIDLQRDNGTIFMNICSEDDGDDQQQGCSKFMYWGYRFEQQCTDDFASKQVHDLEHCAVLYTTIGSNRIFLAAEMDCIDESTKEYVEIKTSRVFAEGDRQHDTFKRHKLLSFWIQSYLGGVSTIYCGFRDDAGKLVKTERLKTLEIPSKCEGIWDPRLGLQWTDGLLQFLRSHTEDGQCYSLIHAAHSLVVTLQPGSPPFLPSGFRQDLLQQQQQQKRNPQVDY